MSELNRQQNIDSSISMQQASYCSIMPKGHTSQLMRTIYSNILLMISDAV